jgi:tetratricopeptide (TPR) repeat protein
VPLHKFKNHSAQIFPGEGMFLLQVQKEAPNPVQTPNKIYEMATVALNGGYWKDAIQHLYSAEERGIKLSPNQLFELGKLLNKGADDVVGNHNINGKDVSAKVVLLMAEKFLKDYLSEYGGETPTDKTETLLASIYQRLGSFYFDPKRYGSSDAPNYAEAIKCYKHALNIKLDLYQKEVDKYNKQSWDDDSAKQRAKRELAFSEECLADLYIELCKAYSKNGEETSKTATLKEVAVLYYECALSRYPQDDPDYRELKKKLGNLALRQN